MKTWVIWLDGPSKSTMHATTAEYQKADLLECKYRLKAITANWNWVAWKFLVQDCWKFVRQDLDGWLCLQHSAVNFIALCQRWTREVFCSVSRFTKSFRFCGPCLISQETQGSCTHQCIQGDILSSGAGGHTFFFFFPHLHFWYTPFCHILLCCDCSDHFICVPQNKNLGKNCVTLKKW